MTSTIQEMLAQADFERRMGCPDAVIARGLEEACEQAFDEAETGRNYPRLFAENERERETLEKDLGDEKENHEQAKLRIEVLATRVEELEKEVETLKGELEALWAETKKRDAALAEAPVVEKVTRKKKQKEAPSDAR